MDPRFVAVFWMFGLSMLLAALLAVLIFSEGMEIPIIATMVLVPAAAIFFGGQEASCSIGALEAA